MARSRESTLPEKRQMSSLKTIMVAAGILFAEGVLIAAVMQIAGRPVPVQAGISGPPTELPEDAQIEERVILDDRTAD